MPAPAPCSSWPCAATGWSSPSASLGLVAFAGGSAKSTLDLYQGQDAVDAARALLASPAITGMYGPVANPDNPDSFAIFKTLLLGAVCVALLAIVLVRRHTRTEEEAGRTELVGAGAVGRRAPLDRGGHPRRRHRARHQRARRAQPDRLRARRQRLVGLRRRLGRRPG